MKRMISVFFTILFASGLFGETRDSHVYPYNISSDEEKDVEVTCKVDDNRCTIVITKDGKVKTITLPLDSLDVLEDFVNELDIDTDINVPLWIEPFKQRKSTWLGVHIQPLTEQLRDFFKVRGSDGVLVSEVVEGSPAEKAELKAGDVILSVDREDIEDTNDLVEVIREKDPGDEVTIRIMRDGSRKTVTATVDSRVLKEQKKIRIFKERFDNDFLRPPAYEDLESLKKEMKELKEELNQLKKELQKPEQP